MQLAVFSDRILGTVGSAATPKRRKTPVRRVRSPWITRVGNAFRWLRESGGYEQTEFQSPRPTISKFENGNGASLRLLEVWCGAMEVAPEDVFLLAALGSGSLATKKLRAYPGPFTARDDTQLLKELAHMLTDADKRLVLGYLAAMNEPDTKKMVNLAHDLWERRGRPHLSAGRAVPQT